MNDENIKIKKFDPTPKRGERNIDQKTIVVPDIKANKIINTFNNSIDSLRKKIGIHEGLNKKGFTEEADDVLRSIVVFLMSAVDFYMHEIVKYSLVKMFKGEKSKTVGYKNSLVPLKVVEKGIKNPQNIDWLEDGIIQQQGFKTFMAADKIGEVLKLISNKEIFSEVASQLGKSTEELKNEIQKIYTRRNKIAHQTDRHHKTNRLSSIKKEEVERFIDLIESFILEVHKIVIEDL